MDSLSKLLNSLEVEIEKSYTYNWYKLVDTYNISFYAIHKGKKVYLDVDVVKEDDGLTELLTETFNRFERGE
jgi:hypothetical protein